MQTTPQNPNGTSTFDYLDIFILFKKLLSVVLRPIFWNCNKPFQPGTKLNLYVYENIIGCGVSQLFDVPGSVYRYYLLIK